MGKTQMCNCVNFREYSQRRGLEIAEEFVDKGISGSRERRPALDKLMVACRKRLLDGVVVYRYDRFARSLRQLVNALEEFRSLDIDLSRSTKAWILVRLTGDLYSAYSPASRSSSGN
jgi:DNA invertase Pin-like site-specific DNA recombinase